MAPSPVCASTMPPGVVSGHGPFQSGLLQQTVVSSLLPPRSCKDISAPSGVSAPPSFSQALKGSSAARPALVVQEIAAPVIAMVEDSLEEARNFAETALVCRFNGVWPRLADLHQWISEVWKPLVSEEIDIYPCARGFFIVDFDIPEDRKIILDSGPWFWGSSGLFMKPWSPLFDPTTDQISSAPVWVRLPNLPLHLWNFASLEAIGNALGSFYYRSPETQDYFRTTFARICVEMDFSKGFPAEIHLTSKDYVWVQKIDYENVLFRCRSCFETGHLAKDCSKSSQTSKSKKQHRKSTWWEGALPEHYTVCGNEDPPKEAPPQVEESPVKNDDTPDEKGNSTALSGDLKSTAYLVESEDALPTSEFHAESSEWTKVGKKKKGASSNSKSETKLTSPRKTRSQQSRNHYV